MSDAVKIKLSPEALAIVSRLGASKEILESIRKAMDYQNQLTVGHIVEKRLTGRGPYPVSQHRLGERSHLYRKSLRAAKATFSGQTVESSIGANVKYAGVHEFGAVIRHKARAGTVRLRTDNAGNLMRQPGKLGTRLAVFAKRSHKNARTVGFSGKAYSVTIPARAPITTGIQDRLEDYGRGVSERIVGDLEGTK